MVPCKMTLKLTEVQLTFIKIDSLLCAMANGTLTAGNLVKGLAWSMGREGMSYKLSTRRMCCTVAELITVRTPVSGIYMCHSLGFPTHTNEMTVLLQVIRTPHCHHCPTHQVSVPLSLRKEYSTPSKEITSNSHCIIVM
jgi:hypothetical protein